MEDEKCKVCESGFPKGYLADGICDPCKLMWPGAKTKEDRNKGKRPDIESQDTRTKNMVNDLLESYGIIHKCDCGGYYFRRSPNQKGCGDCPRQVGEAAKKETK